VGKVRSIHKPLVECVKSGDMWNRSTSAPYSAHQIASVRVRLATVQPLD
jgi:hypothetical protein